MAGQEQNLREEGGREGGGDAQNQLHSRETRANGPLERKFSSFFFSDRVQQCSPHTLPSSCTVENALAGKERTSLTNCQGSVRWAAGGVLEVESLSYAIASQVSWQPHRLLNSRQLAFFIQDLSYAFSNSKHRTVRSASPSQRLGSPGNVHPFSLSGRTVLAPSGSATLNRGPIGATLYHDDDRTPSLRTEHHKPVTVKGMQHPSSKKERKRQHRG